MNEIKTQLLLKPIMEHSKTDISDTEKQVDETIKKAQEHLRFIFFSFIFLFLHMYISLSGFNRSF